MSTFMCGCVGEVGIAGATEHAQVLIRGGDTVEGDNGFGHTNHLGV
jgi:hypothetical protein